jgi:adenylate cyclase
MTETRKLAAILVADVVGYSRLAGADEERTLSRLRGLRSDLFDPAIAAHRGRIVKRTGDGAIVEFRSVVDAVRCAIEVQSGMAERNAGLPLERRILLRIGVHIGDVVEESDGDLMGDGVNIAARLEGVAKPGAICLSEQAYWQVKGRLDLVVSDLGAKELKNIAEPIRVYSLEVGPASEAKASPHAEDGPARPPSAEPSSRDKPSIAVLAFNNMSGDPEQDYFSDGISEDIITDLSKLQELRVIARNSSFAYKGKSPDVKQVGRDLGVRYVLEGSVRKAGARVRVTGQLIDAESGAHVWADRFDRELTDIFAVQDELTREIIAALKVNLTPSQKDRLGRRPQLSAEAYGLFMRGREQALLQTKVANVEARALLERAIALQPNFAAAHAYIAFTRLNEYVVGSGEAAERSLATGYELASQAVAIDGEDPYARFVLSIATLWRREFDKALAEVQRCLALEPNHAEGHLQYANVQYYTGNPAGAIDTLNAYTRLDPLYPGLTLHFLAQAQHALGE